MNYMLCEHKKSKKKLVSWAIDSRYGHEQGFKIAECCIKCGKVIDKKRKQHLEDKTDD